MIQMKKPLVGDTTNLSPRWGFTILPNINGGSRPRLCSIALTGLLLMISTLFAKLEHLIIYSGLYQQYGNKDLHEFVILKLIT